MRIQSIVRRFGSIASPALCLAICSFLGCAWPRQIRGLRGDLEATKREFEQFKSQSQELWAASSCTVADRDLFDRIRVECPPESTRACKPIQVYPALRKRGGLQMLYRGQKIRESFYIPRDTSALPPYRRDKLEKLVRQGPLFESTRFVVVVHTDPDVPEKDTEATQRSDMVVKLLSDHLLKAQRDTLVKHDIAPDSTDARKVIDKLIWRWRYDAPIKAGDLETVDRPQLNIGEPNNINRGIWVFRVDC